MNEIKHKIAEAEKTAEEAKIAVQVALSTGKLRLTHDEERELRNRLYLIGLMSAKAEGAVSSIRHMTVFKERQEQLAELKN